MRFPRLGSTLLLGATLFAGQPSEITGDYVEGRSNHVYGCYCEFSGEGAFGGTEAILAWHIKAGQYRGVPLSGVKIAAVLVSEQTLSMGSNPRKSVLVVDSAASAAQRQAAEKLLRQQYGELLGEITSVHQLPILFERDADRATLTVGPLLNLWMRKARLPEDALQGSRTWFDPFIPLEEFTLATTLNNKFRGRDFAHQWDNRDMGTTGYYGRFRLAVQ